MSEQATMTRGQLEKLGYIVTNEHQVISPDGWEFMNPYMDALQAATAHYRQQQELAALREFKLLVGSALDNFIGSTDPDAEVIFRHDIAQAYDDVTVSEGETK